MNKALIELAAQAEKASADQQADLLKEAYQALRGVWPDAGDWHQAHEAKRFARMVNAEAFESAAMTLVPVGLFPLLDFSVAHCRLRARHGLELRDVAGARALAAVPALALLAAALRAIATEEEGG